MTLRLSKGNRYHTFPSLPSALSSASTWEQTQRLWITVSAMFINTELNGR